MVTICIDGDWEDDELAFDPDELDNLYRGSVVHLDPLEQLQRRETETGRSALKDDAIDEFLKGVWRNAGIDIPAPLDEHATAEEVAARRRRLARGPLLPKAPPIGVDRNMMTLTEDLDGNPAWRRHGGELHDQFPPDVEAKAGYPGTPVSYVEYLPHMTLEARTEAIYYELLVVWWNRAQAEKAAGTQPTVPTQREVCRQITALLNREGFEVSEDSVRYSMRGRWVKTR